MKKFLKLCPLLLLIMLSIIIILFNKEKQNFSGFKKINKNVYYQLIKFGEHEKKPVIGDYVTCYFTFMNLDDSVLFEGMKKIKIEKPDKNNSIFNCLLMLSENDCAIFIIPFRNFNNDTIFSFENLNSIDDKYFKLKIELLEVQSEKDYLTEKQAFLKWIEDFNEYEKVILNQFIENKNLSINPDSNGIYRLILNKGNERKVKYGDTVIIHYEGKFLNGKFFDSSVKRNQPFEFVYGTECQLIQGLYKNIGNMCEGEKDLVIIPSELAFGSNGSSTGLIPPYTSLLFEVEIMKIK